MRLPVVYLGAALKGLLLYAKCAPLARHVVMWGGNQYSHRVIYNNKMDEDTLE